MRLTPPLPVCADAEFSADGLERLWLSRRVRDVGPLGLYLGLNPSTAGADASDNDQTIRKEIGFAERLGWCGFWKGNLFTHIETHSAKLKALRLETAVGQGDRVLEAMLPLVDIVVVCWGDGVPKHMVRRVAQVTTMIRALKRPDAGVWCFGLTQGGAPLHPLRLGYNTPLCGYNLPPERTGLRDEDG